MPNDPRFDPTRSIRAPRGTELHCKSWLTEAAYRMLQNNLDAEVAENPASLVVYGGIGRAARDWACFDQILASLRTLEDDQTLLIQSGKPVGVFQTHVDAPRVLIANSNLVPKWATWEHFSELDRKGLFMYGQMTAGSWIYIGTQGIVQGTYETFAEAGRQHFGGDWSGRWPPRLPAPSRSRSSASRAASISACAPVISTSRRPASTMRWHWWRTTRRARKPCRSACWAMLPRSCRNWCGARAPAASSPIL
jgi:hypothetical protein